MKCHVSQPHHERWRTRKTLLCFQYAISVDDRAWVTHRAPPGPVFNSLHFSLPFRGKAAVRAYVNIGTVENNKTLIALMVFELLKLLPRGHRA